MKPKVLLDCCWLNSVALTNNPSGSVLCSKQLCSFPVKRGLCRQQRTEMYITVQAQIEQCNTMKSFF